MRARVLAWTIGLALSCAPSPPAGAQEPADLARVEELSRMGRTAEARSALDAWWARTSASAARPDLQRALWLRGRLALDPARAQLDFQRLVIEYPGGPFSDLALFRLAQAAYASGDAERTRSWVGQLAREYPESPVRRGAEDWLRGVGEPPSPPLVAFAELAPAPGGALVDAPGPAAERAGAGVRYAVQLGAFSSLERARRLAEGLREGGFTPRLVRVGDGALVHVRVGTFDSEGPARDLLERLQDLGYTAALARDADREEVIR